MIALVVFSMLLTTFSFYFYQVFKGSNVLTDREDRVIVIKKGETFGELRKRLYDDRVIQDALSFSFVAKVLNYQKAVKPGAYLFESGMSNLEMVRRLRAGDQIPVRITFNNVRLKEELAEKVTANTGIAAEDMLKLLNNKTFLQQYKLTSDNAMTIFLPDTYEVYWTLTAEELFDKMYKVSQKFWTAARKEKAAELNLSPVEVSVLASIVQAESILPDEKRTIAGLYLNRLRRNILLQADPTLVYALGDFSIQRVLNEHKQIESPYNTYKYHGLPPGPINLPSLASLDAVLNYEKHHYIYMCAKEDFSGYHRFATNLRDHNKNARLFQQALNKKKIYR